MTKSPNLERKACVGCGEMTVYKFTAGGSQNRRTACAKCHKKARDNWVPPAYSAALTDSGRTATCARCKETKPVTDFYRQTTNRADGVQCYCKECTKARMREYHHKNKALRIERDRAESRRRRAEIITAYGGKCACCGEANHAFLTLDHVHGNGSEHRAIVGGSRQVWDDLRRRGYPQGDYQILCYNCNCAKRTGDRCPHQLDQHPLPERTPDAFPGVAQLVAASPRPVEEIAIDLDAASVSAEFAREMRAARKDRGMTLAQLSVATGIGASMLSSVERGVAERISIASLNRIVAGLGRRAEVRFVQPDNPS